MTPLKEDSMAVIILGILSVILLLAAVFFYYSLTKLQKILLSIKEETSFYKDIFNAIPIVLFYKNGAKEDGNKAFHHAFGPYKKELFEHLQTLPKNSEQNIELTYDNRIKKNSLVINASLLDAQNNVVGLSGAILDMHAWNKSKENLLIQRERLELALDGSQEGIFDWDMEKDIVFYSPKWKQIMGYESHETPNTLLSWLNLVHPKDIAHVNEVLAQYLGGHSSFLFVEHRIRESEPLIWIAVRAKVILSAHNKPLRMCGTIRDISLRKKSEEKQRIYKDMFVSFVDNLPILAYIKDAQGRFIYVNSFFQKYLGFQVWHTKSAHELFDANTAEKMAEYDRLALYESKIEHSLDILNEEGVPTPFDLYIFPIDSDDAQKLVCGVGINKSFRE